ncbi:hypothetical protein [Microbulbifer halophilus]|uniref:N-acetyltransferase domain-containing protein n=1 Tax=Microbulbifer halophilus TaxID=453963 RepID=A0ABW5EEF7_9GAMM|nr:hypothetical protein [Microbulbifer halophilus]MCW8127377.1 hypothetical protein [Microbulbifer halophilus]
MLATHMDAERRYDLLRKASLRAIASQLDSARGLELRLIDQKALSKAGEWSLFPERKVDWEWSNYHDFRLRYPKRFELALWHRSQLASLSLGRPTYSATGLRLDFIEKNPRVEDIKVFQITLAAMNVYADTLGATELRIMNPINNEVKQYYERFGLTYISKGDYLVARI